MTESDLKKLNIARIVVLLLAVVYVLSIILINTTAMSFDSLRRFFFDIKSALSLDIPESNVIDFEPADKNTYSVFKDGLAILSQKKLTVYSRNNVIISNYIINLSEPVLDVSDDYMLVFDRGGNTVKLCGSFDEYGTVTTNDSIITASVSDKGYFAVVTEAYGYNAQVTVYNKKMDVLFYWYSSETYVIDVVFSASDVISVIGIAPDKENIDVYIHRINFRTGELQKNYIIEDAFPVGIKQKNDNSCEILTDEGVYSVRSDFARKISNDITASTVTYFQDERNTVILSSVDSVLDEYSVTAVSSTGTKLFTLNIIGVNDVCCFYDVFLVLCDNELYVIDDEGKTLYTVETDGQYNGIRANREALYLIGNDSAEKIDISEAFS